VDSLAIGLLLLGLVGATLASAVVTAARSLAGGRAHLSAPTSKYPIARGNGDERTDPRWRGHGEQGTGTHEHPSLGSESTASVFLLGQPAQEH